MQNKLLPCPFCCGEAELYEQNHREYASTYYVRCKRCKVQTSPCIDESIIIEDWNTRKPIERIVEQLEEVGTAEAKSYVSTGRCNGKSFTVGYIKGFEKALEIVKAGGTDAE